ncbi:MAG: putative RNA pseudouridine synthase [Fimbriimonadales bacterium]
MAERLQKLLAAAGYGSRRACEVLILEGRVSVNGTVVTELGAKADLTTDVIAVDGKPIARPRLLYVLMNKPPGYVTTVRDPRAGRSVMQLLPDLPTRVFPVGRLDKDTSGVLLFTNDGDLANRLTHPSHGVRKTYRAVVGSTPSDATLERLRKGVRLEDGMTAPAEVRVLGQDRKSGRCTLELVIKEGRKRQVRRMLEAVGHPVEELTRTRFGPLSTYRLPKGACRMLSNVEVERLYRLVGL